VSSSPTTAGSSTPEQTTHENILLALVCVAQFMVVLDVSIVNVALPDIGRSLDYSTTGLQWVVNAYVLTFAGFLLLGGRAADLFGRRRVFLAGLGLFTLASLLGGLAQSSAELTAARAAQGFGGAVLSPATLTIIMTTFSEGPKRHRALGAWSAVAGAGGAFGVILGGVLTSTLSWRWVLFVNVPIGVLAAVAAGRYLTERKRPDAGRNLDIMGAVLVTLGLAIGVYAIVGTDTHPWGSARTLGLLAVSLVLLTAFVYGQARIAKAPLMPLSLFRSRFVTGANVVMLLMGVIFFSMWYFLSLYLQEVYGDGPLKTGLLFLPMSLGIIVGAQISARVIGRFGPRALLLVGIVLMVVGFAWLGQASSSGYTAGVLGPTLLITVGVGLCFTPLATAATTGVHWSQAGLASGVLNTARQVGGSLGLAILATVASAHTRSLPGGLGSFGGHGQAYRTALAAGYDRAFTISAGVALAALLATFIIPAQRKAPPSARPLEAPADSQPSAVASQQRA
jgi:EmrB/QacA subfamily drug resistance transporter